MLGTVVYRGTLVNSGAAVGEVAAVVQPQYDVWKNRAFFSPEKSNSRRCQVQVKSWRFCTEAWVWFGASGLSVDRWLSRFYRDKRCFLIRCRGLTLCHVGYSPEKKYL